MDYYQFHINCISFNGNYSWDTSLKASSSKLKLSVQKNVSNQLQFALIDHWMSS